MIPIFYLLLLALADGTDTPSAADTSTQAEVSSAAVANDSGQGLAYQLAYQFHSGEKLRYEFRQSMTQKALADFGEKADRSQVIQRRLYTISEVADDGTASASMQFEHVHMELQTDDQEAESFDSTMAPEDIPKKFHDAARRLKAAAAKYSLRTSGTPISAEGNLQVSEGSQAGFMIPLPTEPIHVGDTWKANIIVKIRIAEDTFRDVTLLRTHQLSKVENDIATINFSTSVVSQVKSPSERVQLLQATPQGEMTFDLKQGRMLKKEYRFDNTVLGAFGPNTMLSAVGNTVETLIAESAADESTASLD